MRLHEELEGYFDSDKRRHRPGCGQASRAESYVTARAPPQRPVYVSHLLMFMHPKNFR